MFCCSFPLDRGRALYSVIVVKPPGTFSVKVKSLTVTDQGCVSLFATLMEICHELDGNNGAHQVLVLITGSGS